MTRKEREQKIEELLKREFKGTAPQHANLRARIVQSKKPNRFDVEDSWDSGKTFHSALIDCKLSEMEYWAQRVADNWGRVDQRVDERGYIHKVK